MSSENDTDTVVLNADEIGFDAIWDSVVVIAALGIATMVVMSVPLPKWGDYIAMEGKALPIEVHIPFISGVFQAAESGPPSSFEVRFRSLERIEYSSNVGGLKRIVATAVAAPFVTFYEENIHLVEARYGNDKAGWPDIFLFATNVRNASSHGGRAKRIYRCRWRGVGMSSSEHSGALLLGDLLSPGDLLRLTIDVADEFRSLKAAASV